LRFGINLLPPPGLPFPFAFDDLAGFLPGIIYSSLVILERELLWLYIFCPPLGILRKRSRSRAIEKNNRVGHNLSQY